MLCSAQVLEIYQLRLISGTHNHLLRSTEVTEGYDGIDEIFLPQQADIFTLDLVRSLRAAVPEEKPHPADRRYLANSHVE